MKKKIVAILKEFEQRDYKRGGVSIAPESYDAIANKIERELIKPQTNNEPIFYDDYMGY